MSLMDVDDDEDDWANNCFKMAARSESALPVLPPPPGPPPQQPQQQQQPLAPPPLPLPPPLQQPQRGGLLERLARFSAGQL